MAAETCVDCSAQLQAVLIHGQEFMRCPWAKADTWTIDGHHVISRIYCNRPYSGKKHPDGVSMRSVQ